MRAPRALWVPFELGRPLGAPDEPAFQRRVLTEALSLLVSTEGPVVLEDFLDDAPGPKAEDSTGWVCPVSFPPPPSEDEGPVVALMGEIDALAPWYQASMDRRGRTLVGVSGMTPRDAARYMVSFLDDEPMERPDNAKPTVQTFKDAFTDLMAYYSEAGTAQPGRRSSRETQSWFWHETAAGRILLELRAKLMAGSDKKLQFVATKIFLPKTQGG